MKVSYEIDEVDLVELPKSNTLVLIRIEQIAGNYIRYSGGGYGGWIKVEDWHKIVKEKYGRVRRILGIPFGISRYSSDDVRDADGNKKDKS
jgi:hypothetical protein